MNKLKFYLLILTCCFITTMSASVVPFLSQRNVLEVKYWKFFKGDQFNAQSSNFNDGDWKDITVPHTYSKEALTDAGYYQGMAWYRIKIDGKQFKNKQRIFIRFEGVGQDAELYINGKRKGKHSGSYSAFVYELTDSWDYHNINIIALKVDNSTNWKTIPVSNFLFNIYGGIYRPVALFSVPENCIDPSFYASSGVFVKTTDLSVKQAKINVKVHLSNKELNTNENLRIEIFDNFKKKVIDSTVCIKIKEENQIFDKDFIIKDPLLWQAKINPNLYNLKVSFFNSTNKDVVSTDFGIRKIEISANDGFLLNNKTYKIYGVCRHQEWQQYACALTDKQHKKDMDLINEVGATAIRLAHYQQSEYIYHLADKYGMLVWAEIPRVHTWSGLEEVNSKQQLKELILQNYNHPSIFCWGLFNEVRAFDKKNAPCVILTKELNDLAHNLDDTRYTTSATDKPMGESMNGITDLQAWNKYIGWYGNDPYSEITNYFNKIHSNYPNIKIAISEYGAGGNIHQQDIKKIQKPLGNYFPEQAQTLYHEESWKKIKNINYLWGSFIWNMFDFSVNQWYRGGIDHLNHKGLVTFDRETKKDAFYFYKANWNKEPMIYLTEKRNEVRNDSIINVKAYCNMPVNVSLIVNGKKISNKHPDDVKIIKWNNVSIKPGRNVVKVYCSYNKEVYTDTMYLTYELK